MSFVLGLQSIFCLCFSAEFFLSLLQIDLTQNSHCSLFKVFNNTLLQYNPNEVDYASLVSAAKQLWAIISLSCYWEVGMCPRVSHCL